jgi:hypothetical protein
MKKHCKKGYSCGASCIPTKKGVKETNWGYEVELEEEA